jgi:hypothetical protein
VTVSSQPSGPVATFASAARSFAVLVHDIPGDRWDGPGLGEWDLRSLVGHTSTVDALVSRVLAELSEAGNPLIQVIGGAGIRLRTYLPTRMFELAVHGLDIARVVDISFALPPDVLREATALAARIAVAEGHGETVLMALTGRAELPPSFSIV